jgi:hypothetical protein
MQCAPISRRDPRSSARPRWRDCECAFDSELRATFIQDGHGAWTLAAGSSRSTYARDHLGAMLGISPPALERLAPPQACSDAQCLQPLPHGSLLLVRDQSA